MHTHLSLILVSSCRTGAVIIFTALLSVIFLRRKIKKYMWLGMFGVVCGLVMVGVADIVFGDNSNTDRNGIISGMCNRTFCPHSLQKVHKTNVPLNIKSLS